MTKYWGNRRPDHWHVIAGTIGCLPDANAVFETKAEAVAYAKAEARDYRDAGFKVSGSAESGRYDIAPINYLTVEPCNDPECRAELEEGL